jgi:hypothetical protein
VDKKAKKEKWNRKSLDVVDFDRWTAYATSNVQRFKERAVAKREYKIKKLAAAMQNESEKAYCVR